MMEAETKSTINNRLYLVQRCLERDKRFEDSRKGVDRILSFDYMGSAEFEFGTLPNTFQKLRSLARDGLLTLTKTRTIMTYQNKPFWVLLPTAWDLEEFEGELQRMCDGTIRTKEAPYLDAWVDKKHATLRASQQEYLQESYKSKRERLTAWLACVERHDVKQQPALWCVHEGTARKLYAELCTPVETKS